MVETFSTGSKLLNMLFIQIQNMFTSDDSVQATKVQYLKHFVNQKKIEVVVR